MPASSRVERSLSPVHLNRIAHALPGPALDQGAIGAWLSGRLRPGSDQRRFERFLAGSGVRTRHAAIDLLNGEGEDLYPRSGRPADTAKRMQLFAERALPLAVEAAEGVLEQADRSRVTHLVVATCTGFWAPGLEIRLLERCGLAQSVARLQIGFMGCYAGVTALRTARDLARSDPEAVVLVVCCELASLHLQPGPEDDALIAACLFGDGAAAALVSASPEGPLLGGSASAVIDDPEGDAMAWRIGNEGFDIRLSRSLVPRLREALDPFCRRLASTAMDGIVDQWYVHPGGPAILREAARQIPCSAESLGPAHRALAAAGNRSSVTVLAMLADEPVPPGSTAVMACGPGLALEGLVLERPA